MLNIFWPGLRLPAAGPARPGPVLARFRPVSDPLKGIPRTYRKPIGGMVTGRGYVVTGSGPGRRISGPGFISRAKHDFLYQFFMLISNFFIQRSVSLR